MAWYAMDNYAISSYLSSQRAFLRRQNEDSSYTPVWKSAKIDNSLNPVWSPSKIPMASLCNGDVYRPLRIEIFDWDSNGKHQTMGIVSPCCVTVVRGGASTSSRVVTPI
jgi:Ca2+-dependent lipid-binding protein